jgi:pimeloyl-ACP methyl ester carboxylesterase
LVDRLQLATARYDPAMPIEGSTVNLASGLTLSYAEQGDRSGPALVLLPGPTDSWRSYQTILEEIPLWIRAIAVSQRGHGDSDKPAFGYRVQDFATDVVSLFDALRVERAVLVGHSGSCFVARRVAVDHPSRVMGLVLEASPTTLIADPGFTTFVESVFSDLKDPIDPDFARAVIIDTSSGGLGSEVTDQLVGELVKVPAHVWREMFAALLEYNDTAELARISVPTLMIWGDEDPLVGREMQEQLAEQLSAGELVIYSGVGHTPRWEEPSRFAAEVAAFVERRVPGRR